MKHKAWWTSKTLWGNVIYFLLVILEPSKQFLESLGLGTEQLVGLGAILNVVNRTFFTNSNLTTRRPVGETAGNGR